MMSMDCMGGACTEHEYLQRAHGEMYNWRSIIEPF